MTVPVNSLFGTEANRIQEVLNRGINFLLPAMDPFHAKQFVGSQGVVPVDQLGRDLKVIRIYQGAFAGVIEPAGPKGDFVLYGDALNQTVGVAGQEKIFLQGQDFAASAQTFPDAFNGPNPKPYRLGVTMRAFVGNMPLSLGEMSADMTPAVIDEIIAPKMMAWAKQIAHHICLYTYLNQNSNYALCALSTTNGNSIAYINSNKTIRFTVDNFAIDRFYTGLRIHIYNAAGTVARNDVATAATQNLMVTKVDELRNIVEASVPNFSVPFDLSAAGIIATDVVVLAGSKGSASTPFSGGARFTGLAGFNSWLKFGETGTDADSAANCLLGDERDPSNPINVKIHPEFKSMYMDMRGQPLTEHGLRKILRAWHRAKSKYGQSIDHILGADGVWLAYEATKIGREMLDRTGRLSSTSSEGSSQDDEYGGISFTMDGRKYKSYTSNFVPSGEVYGVKLGGKNWKRHVPPGPKNTKKMDKTESWAPAEFVAPALTGTGSPFFPILKGNLMTEFVQMPIMLRMQLSPDQPAGMKLVNVAEDRVYADL